MHESHETHPCIPKNLLTVDSSQSPKGSAKSCHMKKVVSQEKVSNVMLQSSVHSATEVLDDFSTHIFKKMVEESIFQ